MLAFRVEHYARKAYIADSVVNEGPYISEFVNDEVRDMKWQHNDYEHPGARDDLTSLFLRDGAWERHVCAFTSVALLKEWFDGFLPPLARNGFAIAVYEVDSVEMGDSGLQVMIDATMARLISREKIDECSLLGSGDNGSQGHDGKDSLLLVR